MQFERLAILDVVKIAPHRHRDQRGYFSEVFADAWFRETVADVSFVQDNQSLSIATATVRGLHFQLPPYEQGKLVQCVDGAIFDVAVDIRPNSKTFGRWVAAELSAENGQQLWIPPGFAHGFATLSARTLVQYKVTAPYSAHHDRGLAWDDPTVGISWPLGQADVVMSDKDRKLPDLAHVASQLSVPLSTERASACASL